MIYANNEYITIQVISNNFELLYVLIESLLYVLIGSLAPRQWHHHYTSYHKTFSIASSCSSSAPYRKNPAEVTCCGEDSTILNWGFTPVSHDANDRIDKRRFTGLSDCGRSGLINDMSSMDRSSWLVAVVLEWCRGDCSAVKTVCKQVLHTLNNPSTLNILPSIIW